MGDAAYFVELGLMDKMVQHLLILGIDLCETTPDKDRDLIKSMIDPYDGDHRIQGIDLCFVVGMAFDDDA